MNREGIYSTLAPVYDRLNGEVDYEKWADYIEECFRRFSPRPVRSVLDLGCGTGSLTLALARRGYDMIGVDISTEMLSHARTRAEEAGLSENILFLCQDMREFELYGTVDAVVSSLDALNHLTRPADLSRCLYWVHNYLEPDGLFLFDLNTPYKFETVYGQNTYVLEDDGVFCVWQNDYRKKSGHCDFLLSVFFEGEDGRFTREDVTERERVWSLTAIRRHLKRNRLTLLSVAEDTDLTPATATAQRYFLAAKAEKEAL